MMQNMFNGSGGGGFGRGSSMFEQGQGSFLQGLMPQMPAMPDQNMQGGQGMLARMSPMWESELSYRFSALPNLKDFLMQYSKFGNRTKLAIDVKTLRKF